MEIATFCQQIVALGTQQQARQNYPIQGLDLQQDPDQTPVADRKKLDAVMLEIMNAC